MSDRRELLMLAKPSKGLEEIGGFYLSEKLDGMRCFWDGGVSRGYTIDEIPWANIGKGTDAVSTGLWSRYGNPIYAPDWFLNELPCCPLDGELFGGRGNFQKTMSAVKKKTPIDAEWKEIRFLVFSTPSLNQLFRDGLIKNPNFEREIIHDDCMGFYMEHTHADYVHLMTETGAGVALHRELNFLESWLEDANEQVLSLLPQLKLPEDNELAWEIANERSKKIIAQGGEGCILRCPKSPWIPRRVGYCLKMKPSSDAECVVTGATAGRKGKTGHRLGTVGNYIVEFTHEDGETVEFELAGINTEEWTIQNEDLQEWCIENPGKRMPDELLTFGALPFEMGQTLTFLYREFSKDKIPKDARYFRPRPSE